MQKLLYVLLLVTLFSCQRNPVLYAIQQQQIAWTDAMRAEASASLESLYATDAGLLLDGQFIQGRQAIAEALVTLDFSLKRMRTLDTLQHNPGSYFELGYYDGQKTSDGRLAYLIAWEQQEGDWLRVTEVIFPLEISNSPNLDDIDGARERWVNLSNAQDHEVLVGELYGTAGLYFNNGQLFKGEEINDKYAYMSRSSWQIQLYGKHVLPVQDDLVYEVGEYHSSGIGHYLIIWKQDENSGEWKVWLDFNY